MFVSSPFKRVLHTTSFATATRQIEIASPYRPKVGGGVILSMHSADCRNRPTSDKMHPT